MSGTAEEQRHLPALDGVRGIAILTVMFYHFYEHFDGPRPWDRVAYYLFETGWAGVDLFFVLSGFLITRNLLEAKGHPQYFRNFYGRRVLRIFPLYYVSLFLLLFLVPALFPGWNSADVSYYRQNQAWLWLHGSNLFSFFKGAQGFLYHFWSLAIEEQFYLFWPAVLFLIPRERFSGVCLVFCSLGIAFRGVGLALGYDTHAIHLLLPARFDTLALGAFLAGVERSRWEDVRRKATVPLVAAVLLIAASFPLERVLPGARWFRQTFYFTALAGIFGYLILSALVPSGPGVFHRAIQSRFLRKLGKHSYSLYIFHTVVAESFPIPPRAFLELFRVPLLAGLVYAATVGSLSFAVSLLTWELVEKRFLALKRYLPILGAAKSAEKARHLRIAS
jgi:peptidoglycan/LPS O-acetylase OafA/YrhL